MLVESGSVGCSTLNPYKLPKVILKIYRKYLRLTKKLIFSISWKNKALKIIGYKPMEHKVSRIKFILNHHPTH